MSNQKSSWPDEIARNFSRLFFRSKTHDSGKSDARGDASVPEKEESRDEDPDEKQVPELSEAFQEEGGEWKDEDGVSDDAGGSGPDQTPPVPAAAVDSFFRRLGSLLHFYSKPETEAEGMKWGSEGVWQPSDTGAGSPGVAEAERGRPGKPDRAAEVTATLDAHQAEDHEPDKLVLEEDFSSECGPETADIQTPEGNKDEHRHQALSCPPVVTYGTYRGLKEVKKMKKRPLVRLQSPISEGDEGQHSRESVSGEDVDSSRLHATEAVNNTSPPELTDRNKAASPASQGDSCPAGAPCISHIPLTAEKIETPETASAFLQDKEVKSQTMDSRPGAVTTTDTFLAAGKDGSATPVGTATVGGTRGCGRTTEVVEQESEQAGSPSLGQIAGARGIRPDIALPGCQGGPLPSRCVPSPEWRERAQSADLGMDVGPSSQGLWQATGLEEDFLQLQSKIMVDNILRNALAALQKIETNEQESKYLHRDITTKVEDASSKPQNLFNMASAGQEERSSLLEDALGSNRTLVEGNRSTPSSGYESIAGSDTDIRCSPGLSCEGSSLITPVSSQQVEAVREEKPGMVGHADAMSSQGVSYRSERESERSNEGQGTDDKPPHKSCLFGEGDSVCPALADAECSVLNKLLPISRDLALEKEQEPCSCKDRPKMAVHEGAGNDEFPFAAKDPAESTIHRKQPITITFDGTITNTINHSNDCNTHPLDNKYCEVQKPNSLALEQQGMHNVEKVVRPKDSQTVQQPLIKNRLSTDMVSNASLESRTALDPSPDPYHGLETGGKGFIVVKTYLTSVLPGDSEDTAAGSTRVQPMDSCNADRPSEGEDRLEWSTVKAFRCTINDDQSQESETLKYGSVTGFCLEDGAKSNAAHGYGKRMHLDPSTHIPRALASGPHHHRLHEMDFHHNDPGFSIISEEEELDTVFVNDTGPMLSPSTRKMKAYPFSLSPIFEEECPRDEASVEENLQVPPVTEEEVKSEEQQSSSILSLLQSVSERLQSSAFSDHNHGQDEDSVDAFHRPCWESYLDKEEGDEEPTVLLSQAWKEDTETHVSTDQTSTQNVQETVFSPTVTFKAEKTADTPFYQYLKSSASVLPTSDSDEGLPTVNVGGSPSVITMEDHVGPGKVIPRPSLLHVDGGESSSATRHEIHADVEDSRGLLTHQGASVHARRGSWLLYVEPGFRGTCVVLEEGETVLARPTDLIGKNESAAISPPVPVGSIRRLVQDDCRPEILVQTCDSQGEHTAGLYSEAESIEAVPLSAARVTSGCWLAFDRPGFRGNYSVLESGGKTTPGPLSPQVTHVHSLRPLKRGGLKVRRLLDPAMEAYDQPHFQGARRELAGNTPSLDPAGEPKAVRSVRVTRGLWVGYTGVAYAGRQFLLEEGEYADCRELCGLDHALLSFRFLQADFVEPSITLLSDSPEVKPVDLVDVDIPELEGHTALNTAGSSIRVKSGVWVAYSSRYFTGDQYVLEKGLHPGTLDWGNSGSKAMSVRPVRLDTCNNEPKFLVRIYSKPHFEGEQREFEAKTTDCDSVVPMSFRVIRGSWLLFDEEGYSGNQFVLEEGLYPDIVSCDCTAAAIKSLKPIPHCFTDPCISLFSLDSFEGLKMTALKSDANVSNFFTQSLRVSGGLWVVYEFSNFKGRHRLLQAGEYPFWSKHSGWDTVGSFRPLTQRRVYIQVRNRALGTVLTTERVKDTSCPAKVTLSTAGALDTQQWLFTEGLLKCKVGKGCLAVIGGKANAGSRVALWPEHGRTHQRWSLNADGTVSTHLNHDLVLDLRGGTGLDKDHLIVSDVYSHKATQYWDFELV